MESFSLFGAMLGRERCSSSQRAAAASIVRTYCFFHLKG
uniref:Uncharacterized protein n=1 Tax=Setaria italica TaxID=4555 RepID=K4ANW7_SETIT